MAERVAASLASGKPRKGPNRTGGETAKSLALQWFPHLFLPVLTRYWSVCTGMAVPGV
ncbi:hypothetical protein ABIF50_001355 [Bradyrhizobium diazoefficiens]